MDAWFGSNPLAILKFFHAHPSGFPAMLPLRRAMLLVLLTSVLVTAQQPQFPQGTSDKPVRVFILAGQSNMEGRGFPEPLTWQLSQEKYRQRYTHFVHNGDIETFLQTVSRTSDTNNPRQTPKYLWSVREDVWINYLGKHGNLTVGYGAPREGFGPEFNFGHVVGNHFDEQVLLIKTSWGGRALAKGFLPPSSMPSDAEFAQMTQELNAKNQAWNEAEPARIEKFNQRIREQNKTAEKKKKPRTFRPRPMLTVEEFRQQYGMDYRNMVREVHECLADLGNRFPQYRGQGYQISGFVWFQGWNDQYNEYWLSYEKNMANFIRDVRREFKVPGLPFVIGQMGNGGQVEEIPEGSPRDVIKKAQAAVAEYPEFRGNVVCVKTDQYWDMDAHRIYTGPGGWSGNIEQWRHFGNDRAYHYYGSPWFFAQVGTAFGEAMLKLQAKD